MSPPNFKEPINPHTAAPRKELGKIVEYSSASYTIIATITANPRQTTAAIEAMVLHDFVVRIPLYALEVHINIKIFSASDILL